MIGIPMNILDKYLEAVKYLSEKQSVPYYLEGIIKDNSISLSIEDFSTLLHSIINSQNTSDILFYFYRGNILPNNFGFLYNLDSVKQNKHKSSNLVEHTIRVVGVVPHDNIDLKWAALFHDIGKQDSLRVDSNFYKHAKYSYDIAKDLCDIFSVQNKEKICTAVLYHMEPGGYQKNPNWSDDAVKNFIEKTHPYTEDVIEMAFYDKKAETNKDEFLVLFNDLKERVKSASN